MKSSSRRRFSAEFKAKVCIEAIQERMSIESLAKKHNLHPSQINTWKKAFLGNSSAVFEKEGDSKSSSSDQEQLVQALYAQIGEQKVAIDFLKKKLQ